jgi:hypothetical protein
MDETYRNSDGVTVEFNGEITTAKSGFWVWSNQLQQNISYGCKTERDALLDSIEHLIFMVDMYRDNRDDLQRKLKIMREAFEAMQEDE